MCRGQVLPTSQEVVYEIFVLCAFDAREGLRRRDSRPRGLVFEPCQDFAVEIVECLVAVDADPQLPIPLRELILAGRLFRLHRAQCLNRLAEFSHELIHFLLALLDLALELLALGSALGGAAQTIKMKQQDKAATQMSTNNSNPPPI